MITWLNGPGGIKPSSLTCPSLPVSPPFILYTPTMTALKQGEFVGSLDCGTTYAPFPSQRPLCED